VYVATVGLVQLMPGDCHYYCALTPSL